MSLLGVDVGTTGCKVAQFAEDGRQISTAYREYDIDHPQPGWAELDAEAVWLGVKEAIAEAVRGHGETVTALSVASLGEAVVPVTRDREILGPSILNFDVRGQAYVDALTPQLADYFLYGVNGNTLGNHYGLTKLMWLRDHRSGIYDAAYQLLPWSSFVSYMLGAEPVVDYSLANRLLLFDVDLGDWALALLGIADLDQDKLPRTEPTGTPIGRVAADVAEELGLSSDTIIVAGAHDQCANAVGCGVIEPGLAVYGMGTFICITPVFDARVSPSAMVPRGLNTEHHAVPDRYVTFIYNQGGSLVKWYRDTFAAREHQQASEDQRDVYEELFNELPQGPSRLVVLPHFTTTGPPSFISDSAGVIAGLRLETSRGAILKGLIEGATYYLKTVVDDLPGTGITIEDFRAVGGGSKSDAWVQLSADIMGRPMVRPAVTEAGALGAAIIAGVGSGRFSDFSEGAAAMVALERTFEPDLGRHNEYLRWQEQYAKLGVTLHDYLRELTQP
jgi:xylulokinase